MKLAKLLGAGKSFFGGQAVISYRENKRVYLPKFNAAKNPFAPKSEEAGVAGADPVPAPVAVAPVVAPKAAVETQKTAVPSVPKPVAPKPARAGWADKLNPFRAPQPAAAPQVATVQPEFSLDAVKVLHNDLSDADVEVVPVKSRTAAPVTPAAVGGPVDYMSEPVLRTI
jgi:hypothetical protein